MTTFEERIAELQQVCPHERKMLDEGGYHREWRWRDNGDGTFTAVDYYPEGFSDEGNGEYTIYCKNCLLEFPVPEDWDWA